MKDAAFQELMRSVRQAGRIRRGTLKAGRTTVFKPEDVKTVRASLGASQSGFALMIGVSVATLQNWEQGRRTGWPGARASPRTSSNRRSRPCGCVNA